MHIILVMAMHPLTIPFVDAELDWLRSKTLSDVSTIAYRGEVDRLSTFCASEGVTNISRMTAELWIAYIECLSTDRTMISERLLPLKPSSALQAVRITRDFLLHCAKRRWIDWDPHEVTVAKPLPAPGVERLRGGPPLSPAVRRVISSAPFAVDEKQARRHFALGLAFWGALPPRELALLKVGNLRINPGTGEGWLTCEHRPHPAILPAELCQVWLRYRTCREGASPVSLKPTAPLIANLRNGAQLSAWSIWALMQSGEEDSDLAGNSVNPRLLRMAYVENTTRDAARIMSLVRGQTGKGAKFPGSQSARARGYALSMLHKATLVELQEMP